VVISILIDIPGKQLFFKKISSIYFCKTNNWNVFRRNSYLKDKYSNLFLPKTNKC
jgi:hypothetical protein